MVQWMLAGQAGVCRQTRNFHDQMGLRQVADRLQGVAVDELLALIVGHRSQRKIFISYRRDPAGKALARSLKTALEHKGYDVFLDVDSMDAGAWEAQVLSEVARRAHKQCKPMTNISQSGSIKQAIMPPPGRVVTPFQMAS